jgi:hypothetical protein
MKVRLPDGSIVQGVDQADVLAKLTAAGVKDVVLVSQALPGTIVVIIEK